ncbi:MAG: hypothetical protein FJZ07_02580 [Candidatus Nealsonbacteria bacterium]|nr:hypothetical protein [Candidatus Nealsonbacteria bacterium]
MIEPDVKQKRLLIFLSVLLVVLLIALTVFLVSILIQKGGLLRPPEAPGEFPPPPVGAFPPPPEI